MLTEKLKYCWHKKIRGAVTAGTRSGTESQLKYAIDGYSVDDDCKQEKK